MEAITPGAQNRRQGARTRDGAMLNAAIRETVLALVRTFRPADILVAIQMIDALPPPGDTPADEVAALIHAVALHAESMADWSLCISLYRRAIEHKVTDLSLRGDAQFRCGLCQERNGALTEAMRAYREALSNAEGYPALAALARFHLARLLMAAEEYQEACELFEQLASCTDVAEVDRQELELALAHCLIRLGRSEEAQMCLERLYASPPHGDRSVEAMRLLAGIHENGGEFAHAAECYRCILNCDVADPQIKAAAAHRLAALGGKS